MPRPRPAAVELAQSVQAPVLGRSYSPLPKEPKATGSEPRLAPRGLVSRWCLERRRSGAAPTLGVSTDARGQMLYIAEAKYPFLSVAATTWGPSVAAAGTVNVHALTLPSEL